MTCIVALKDEKDGKLYIGGDSAATNGGRRLITAVPKVYKKGEFLIGGSGYFSVLQNLSHSVILPPVLEGQDPTTYLVNEFVPSFKKTLRDSGLLSNDHGLEEVGNNFLIGFRGEIFNIGCDFDVFTSMDNYASVGSGSSYALGSLFTTEGTELTPEERILIALEAAAKNDSYVGGPLEVISETGEVTQLSEMGELVRYSADGEEIKEERKEGKNAK